jgi:hypothetical protein
VDGRVISSDVVRDDLRSRHNTSVHNILSTAPQLSISQKVIRSLRENGYVMPKHEGATKYN